jgi:putative FmdB family regulatory protein
MPVYEYRCEKCKTQYDIFHKGREIREDIVCPSCRSKKYKKLMSVSAVSAKGEPEASCGSGECCGGTCGMN